MRLLLCLADHAGQVVSIDELLDRAWPGISVTPDSVYQAVAALRRQLGDDSKQPRYIETVPRLGYRMVAAVSTSPDQTAPPALPVVNSASHLRLRRMILWPAAAVVFIALGIAAWTFLPQARTAHAPPATTLPAPPQRSIAVLPFLDLTEGMKEETFADGMTEELIDKLSKIHGLRVASPTSSFYFKGKQVPVSEIARALGVVYVLDGSVRKSGIRLRVAAQLVRANDGYIVWSDTYDRPLHDILMVQDDIAGEVTKALKASIEAAPAPDQSQ